LTIDRVGAFKTSPELEKLQKGLGPTPKKYGKAAGFDAPHEFTEGPDSLKDPDLQVQWIADRMGWPNLATDPEICDRAKQVVHQEIASTKTSLEYQRNKWLILYRLFRGESLSKFFWNRGNVHVPEPFKAVESMVPRVHSALFDNEPWHKVVGREMSDDAGAKMMQGLLDYQIYETDLVRRAERVLRTLCMYGTAPCYTWWRQDLRRVQYRKQRRIPDEKIPGAVKVILESVDREEVIHDHNDFKPVSLWDFYAPPLASSVEEAEWAAHRALYNAGMIRAMIAMRLWVNWEEIQQLSGNDNVSHDDEFKQRKSYSIGVWDPTAELQTAGVGHYEVYERWGLFILDEQEGPVECQIVVVQPRGKCIPVRICRNPYWHGKKPYIVPRYTVVEEEMFGIGVIEPIAKLSIELDAKRQLALQAQHLSCNPILICGDDANIPDEQLNLEPGLVLRAATADGIKALVLPDVSDAAIKGENLLKADIRETTGVVATMMGSEGPGGETATEVSRRMNESNVRVKGVIGNFEREFVIPLMQQWDWNNQQFLNVPKAIRILGAQGLSWKTQQIVTPEKIAGRYDHVALASYRLSSLQVMTQHLINVLDRAPALNMANPGMIKMPQLLAKILKEGFGFRDVDDFIALPPEDAEMPSALEEQEAWTYGEISPVRSGENLLRHYQSHTEYIQTPTFEKIAQEHPDIAAKVYAHVADTAKRIAQQMEQQEQQMMLAQQQLAVQGQGAEQGGGGEAGGRGFNEPGQAGGSPNFRSEGPKDVVKSEATQNAPNLGAS